MNEGIGSGSKDLSYFDNVYCNLLNANHLQGRCKIKSGNTRESWNWRNAKHNLFISSSVFITVSSLTFEFENILYEYSIYLMI